MPKQKCVPEYALLCRHEIPLHNSPCKGVNFQIFFLGNRVRLFDSFILARMFFFFNSTLWCLWAGPLAVQSRHSNSRKTNDFQAVCLVKWRCLHGLSKMWYKLHKSGPLVENITVVVDF